MAELNSLYEGVSIEENESFIEETEIVRNPVMDFSYDISGEEMQENLYTLDSDSINDDVSVNSEFNYEETIKPPTDEVTTESGDDYDVVGGDILPQIKELYSPAGDFEFKGKVENNALYQVPINNDYKKIIEDALSTRPEVSIALEELGLHNRLSYIEGVERRFGNCLILRGLRGDYAVAINKKSPTDILKRFMDEAKEKLSQGKRIEIKLVETYEFKDSYGRILKRERFRASMSDIMAFIRATRMKGEIVKEGVLVVYEWC